MALIFNNNTISTSTGVVKYNGNNVTKVVYNGTTVWEKVTATPYYLVQSYTIKVQLSATVLSASNANAVVGSKQTLTVGSWASSFGDKGQKDDTKASSVTLQLDPLDTKGCSTFEWKAGIPSPNPSQYISIDGGSNYDAHEGSCNVSGKSSITVKLVLNAWPTHQCLWQVETLRFY